MSDEMLNKIDAKIDKLDERLDNVDKTLVRHEENLKEHMRRSAANEKAVELLSDELKPVQKHVQFVNFTFKLVSTVFGAIASILGILELIKKI